MSTTWLLSVFIFLIVAAGSRAEDCVLPRQPVQGHYVSYEEDCPASSQSPQCVGVPGTKVPPGWLLFVSCHQGFKLVGSGEVGPSTCVEGVWLPALPTCVYDIENDKQKCVLPSPPAHGSYQRLEQECATSGNALPGSAVASACPLVYSCDQNYQLTRPDLLVSICENSSWNPHQEDFICVRSDTMHSTHKTVSSSSPGCSLPLEAKHRRFCSFHCQDCDHGVCRLPPGSLVTDPARVQCASGYGFANNQQYVALVCINDTWIPDIPDCLKLCPPLESDSVYPSCVYGTTQVNCSKPMLPGTTAVYQCKPSHTEYPSLTQAGVYKRTLTCRHNGRWSYMLPECEPVCGVSQGGIKITPTIVDGTDTPLGAFPWHAGLYWQKDGEWVCFCGGTLISNRMILTAAHCVISLVDTPENLQVALGKVHRAWSYDEPHTVKLTVSNIEVPSYYDPASRTYLFDMALLLLSKKVQVNNFIMPACRDVNLDLKITGTSTGYVVGWGLTSENGKASETLLHNDFSIMDYKTCHGKVIIKQLLTYDKFCGAKNSGSVAQKGDSGGGVTTVYNQQHYVIGIVSSKFSNDLSLFTNLSLTTHRSWIETSIEKFNKLII